jgi:hypothetical protein
VKYIATVTLGLFILIGSIQASFDQGHSIWAEVLRENVSKKGNQSLVDYRSIKRSPMRLNSYLRELSKVSQSEFSKFSKNERLAFLINSYNAFTVKLIIDNYPLKSIKNIGNFFSGPWDKEFITLLGKKTNLDNIEHVLIRKNFREPRIHFAVNCASIGCPNLSLKPFRAVDLNQHLETMAEEFMGDRNKNNYDSRRNRVNISKIFKWYGSDFEKQFPGGLNAFLAKHLGTTSQQKNMIERGSASKRYLDYDWSLNKSN